MDEQQFLRQILADQSPNVLAQSPDILVGRGDDAAVVRVGEKSLVLTTDSFIEGRHFERCYFSPEEIGAKAVEASASDIIAMGARPRYVLWSLVFGDEEAQSNLEFYRALAKGVESACARLSSVLIGGNLAKGRGGLQLTMTVIGELASKRAPCCRSGARVGDVVCVSGHLGASSAGLWALQKSCPGFEELKRLHRNTRCRLDLVDKIGAHATSMIDISDGLSSELHYLSSASGVMLEIQEARLPIHPEVTRLAAEHGLHALDFVYGGGEDYELLFTLPEEKARLVPATVIGRVAEGIGVFAVSASGERRELMRAGYNHLGT